MTVLDKRPEQLADGVDLAAVLDALNDVDILTNSQCSALEYAASFWLNQVVSRGADPEGVLLLDEVCALAAQRAPHGADPFRAALAAWRSVLEHKRRALASRTGGGASQLRQFAAVVAALQSGEVSQSTLAAQLALTAGRVSQILTRMEQDGVVTKRRLGRENLVSLVDPSIGAARPGDSPHPAQTAMDRAAVAETFRGLNAFNPRKVA